ncbi:gypsy type transposase [Tanacetum coccineum]
MEYIPLYDTDKGFNDVGDVEFQDNWGRVWVDIGTSDYFALDVLLNYLTILSSSSYVSIHNVIDKPLVLSWGQTPRLDFGVRVSIHDLSENVRVRVGERQRAEGKPKLLDTTVGRVVLILPVAPARALSELEASVEKLFDEGGSSSHTERGDSVSGGHGVDILQVSVTAEIVVEDAVPVQPKRQRKRKTVVSDAGEPSHPPKKLKEDHGTSTGPSVASKSKSALQRLLTRAVLNLEVGVATLPTLPFITSSVSVTPEREDGNQSDFMVDSFARPSVPLMTMATTVTSTADPTTTTKERFVEPSIFGGGSSFGAEHTVGGFFGLTGSDFIIGGAARQMSLSAEVRMRAEFNIREKRRLCSLVEEKDSLLKARDEEIKSLKAQLLVKETKAAEAIHIRAEASKFKVVEKSLQDEIKSLKECNTALAKEKGVLDVKVADLAATVKVREQEAADSDAMVTTVHELETSSARLQEKVAVYENCMSRLEKFQDEKMAVMHEKFNKLDADFVEMWLHLGERFYPHLLTTITGCWEF